MMTEKQVTSLTPGSSHDGLMMTGRKQVTSLTPGSSCGGLVMTEKQVISLTLALPMEGW